MANMIPPRFPEAPVIPDTVPARIVFSLFSLIIPTIMWCNEKKDVSLTIGMWMYVRDEGVVGAITCFKEECHADD